MSKYFPFIFSLFLICSCDLHSSDNGPLDNFWYLRQIDTLQTSGTTDYVSQKAFWSYVDHLMQTEKDGIRYLYRFEQTSSQLTVSDPRIIDKKNINDLATPEQVKSLEKHGLHLQSTTDGNYTQTFEIEELNNKRMILNDGIYRLHFLAY